jgi:hypothetical protein
VRARDIGFFDVNASNFLITNVPAGPYIDVVKSVPGMIDEGRKTKQGLRDLNDYGPRRVKNAAGDPPAAAVADEEVGPEAGPPARSPVEAPAEGARSK